MSNYHIKSLEEYFNVYRRSIRNPETFWAEVAEEHFLWRKKWDKVLEWDFKEPKIEWFKGAKLNITENCIDRHLVTKADQPAILLSLIILMKILSLLVIDNYTNVCVKWLMF